MTFDHQTTVDIICPKCNKRAHFHSSLVGSNQLYPDVHGKVTCVFCGFNGLHTFSKTDYFYQIPIADRTLFARNKENLIALRDYFSNYDQQQPRHSPESDFPKVFYTNRIELVIKIERVLENDL